MNEAISNDKKKDKLSGQYLNSGLRLISSTNIFETENSDKLNSLSAELGELLPKFEKISKEIRRRIDKGFIKKIKNAVQKE